MPLACLAVVLCPLSYCQAQTDYFLLALSTNANWCVSPNGGQWPDGNGTCTLNYWDTPAVVSPGQWVTNQISYTVSSGNDPDAVIFKTVLAEWQPNTPIAILQNGILEGSPGTTVLNFGYTAPTTPGIYRLRLAMTWAYAGIQHFYGDGPLDGASNPGVGRWAEVIVRVGAAPTIDFFLQALTTNANWCVSPNGGQWPDGNGTCTLNYWDTPAVVSPGQWVTNQISYTVSSGNDPDAVIYKTVLAEWQTNTPIAVLEDGILEGNPGRTVLNFGYTAPTTPGIYRLRLAMTWAYAGIQHFYGDGPLDGANNPGVGRWAEVIIRVVAPPTMDYFLEALSTNANLCVSPNGGQWPDGNGTCTLNYWDTPAVVSPGQWVTNQISYTVSSGNDPDAVIFKTVLAEWQPNTPIAILQNGILEGSPGTTVLNFGYTAPTTPGIYRLRLAMTWAYAGIQHFYGDGPLDGASNPGVGRWAEVVVRVEPMQPVFTSAFSNVTATLGESVTLAVEALGGQPLSYYWFFNGSPISGASGESLNLPSVQYGQAGTYSVIVSNVFGTVTNTAILSVMNIKMYAGIILGGAVGANYQIDYMNALGGTNTWQTLSNVTLTASPSVFFDMDSPNQPKRFYRALLIP